MDHSEVVCVLNCDSFTLWPLSVLTEVAEDQDL